MTDQGRQDPRRSIVEWLNSGHIEAEIKRALPDHVPVDWFLRLAQTALLNNPNLASADKATLLRELVAVAQLGLVLDPQLGEAWLIIDRHGKVQRRVGYQGLRRLAMQSGDVTSLNAQAVYKNDICSVTLGDSPSVKHELDIQRGDRGTIVGYYAVARVRGIDEPVVEWMSEAQVAAHRDRYSDAYKGGKSGPWGDPLAAVEMGRKTVFRRLAKWLPKSPLLAEALADEDRADMRDVTPGSQDMLPAPSDDPMDQVVADATTQRSRPEPAGAPTAEPGPKEDMIQLVGSDGEFELPRSQVEQWARDTITSLSDEDLEAFIEANDYVPVIRLAGHEKGMRLARQTPEPAAPTKRKPGRPSKAETEARQQEALARQIIDEINAAAPAEVDGVLQTREEDIASLSDELHRKVSNAAENRKAATADDEWPGSATEDDYQDPLDAEGKPPVGETSGADPDDGFDVWRAEMETAVGRMDPTMRAIPARKTYWLRDAQLWGERGVQAVEEAFAR